MRGQVSIPNFGGSGVRLSLSGCFNIFDETCHALIALEHRYECFHYSIVCTDLFLDSRFNHSRQESSLDIDFQLVLEQDISRWRQQ